ncbi:GyrI-like domain-containing protein [Brevibacillus borstelensis]|uniref:GyrI-like domain-containing protein n=1 Tax=Brevibacillus borstelensis TaxID=45462 RepID=UPI001376EB40|nr:GyrI-like domain-containing protein [Brevibacillus borstelensis]
MWLHFPNKRRAGAFCFAVGRADAATLASNRVPALWEEFLRRVNEIHDRTSPNISMGISEFSQNHLDEEFVCMACVPVNRFASIPEGMVCKTIPTMQYVVVTHKGKLPTLGNAFDYIYTTWLPNSGYDLVEADDFEVYGERFLGPENEDSEVDIYIPIKKVQ